MKPSFVKMKQMQLCLWTNSLDDSSVLTLKVQDNELR